MKHSKLQRKFLNQMRGMSDIPWPARRFKYAPTFGDPVQAEAGQCHKQVDEVKVRQGRLKRKKAVPVLCGGKMIVKRGRHGRRRVYCESCRARTQQRKLELRLADQFRRFGFASGREAREERRSVRMLQKFRRVGAR